VVAALQQLRASPAAFETAPGPAFHLVVSIKVGEFPADKPAGHGKLIAVHASAGDRVVVYVIDMLVTRAMCRAPNRADPLPTLDRAGSGRGQDRGERGRTFRQTRCVLASKLGGATRLSSRMGPPAPALAFSVSIRWPRGASPRLQPSISTLRGLVKMKGAGENGAGFTWPELS
jgi:hypothetical protein